MSCSKFLLLPLNGSRLVLTLALETGVAPPLLLLPAPSLSLLFEPSEFYLGRPGEPIISCVD